MNFFAGNIALIYNPNIVTDILFNDPAVIVISLDEDNDKPALNPDNNPRVNMGTILLPEVDALGALFSGDFEMFQIQYYMHLNEPEVAEFIFFLLGLAYRGYKIILYYPDESSEIIQYLHAFIEQTFGVHICIPSRKNDLFAYDINKIPMYLSGIYYQGIISADEYLAAMPANAPISNNVFEKLMIDKEALSEDPNVRAKILHTLHTNKNKVSPFIF